MVYKLKHIMDVTECNFGTYTLYAVECIAVSINNEKRIMKIFPNGRQYGMIKKDYPFKLSDTRYKMSERSDYSNDNEWNCICEHKDYYMIQCIY